MFCFAILGVVVVGSIEACTIQEDWTKKFKVGKATLRQEEFKKVNM